MPSSHALALSTSGGGTTYVSPGGGAKNSTTFATSPWFASNARGGEEGRTQLRKGKEREEAREQLAIAARPRKDAISLEQQLALLKGETLDGTPLMYGIKARFPVSHVVYSGKRESRARKGGTK